MKEIEMLISGAKLICFCEMAFQFRKVSVKEVLGLRFFKKRKKQAPVVGACLLCCEVMRDDLFFFTSP